jgi:hypothetical protein
MLVSGYCLSFVRQDVFDKINELGLSHIVKGTEQRCLTANGGPCEVMWAATEQRCLTANGGSCEVMRAATEQHCLTANGGPCEVMRADTEQRCLTANGRLCEVMWAVSVKGNGFHGRSNF